MNKIDNQNMLNFKCYFKRTYEIAVYGRIYNFLRSPYIRNKASFGDTAGQCYIDNSVCLLFF